MKTTNPEAVAATISVAATRWPHLLNELTDTVINPHLARPKTRTTIRDLIGALLAPLARKNCWTLAEHAQHPTPYRMQHLLNRARMDETALATSLRGYIAHHLGSDDVVLVVDETGDLKKGTHTVGVTRQYSGTAGRIENCQVAVYLTYTTPDAHALIDHRLYLPRAWTDDTARLTTAGVPADIGFATKPELARQMIASALNLLPGAWVAADEVYGRNPALRAFLEEHRVGYAMAASATDRLATPRGPLTLKELAVLLPGTAWQQRSAGAGAKGERFYDWALIDDRANAAGRRWRVEESFAQGKGLAGLDEHQVRTWTSWRRWSLLAMAAYAFVTVCRLREARHHPAPEGLVALTCNEIALLFHALFRAESTQEHMLAWSVFRRSHQAKARNCHYRRQAAHES